MIGAAQAILEQDRPRALDHLSKAQALTQEGLAEVRHSVAALRASPTESGPLPVALTKLAEQWNAAGLRAKFVVAGTIRPLTPQANLTLYRAAQEALTNVGKHAYASSVDLQLDYRDERLVRLRIKDDGLGSANSEGGFGLLGVRERVQLLNGAVRVRADAGEGFSLEVELPALTRSRFFWLMTSRCSARACARCFQCTLISKWLAKPGTERKRSGSCVPFSPRSY